MANNKDGHIVEQSEAAFIDSAQAASISGNHLHELAARGQRELLPTLVRWMNDERKRGTPDDQVLGVLPSLLYSQLGTAALNMFRNGPAAAEFMNGVKPIFDEEWARTRGIVRETKL